MILAIECSLPDASLCLADENGRIISSHSWRAVRNHDSFLFPALEAALEQLAEDKLETILIGAGPGSYGGVRVALAAGVGISMVRGATMVAIDSWTQLVEEPLHIISDAKRGGWTLRLPEGEIQVLSTEEIILHQANQEIRYASVETKEKLNAAGIRAEAYELKSTAQGLVSSWIALSETEREKLAAKPPEPIYVRPPHITKAKKKAWER